MKAKFFRNQSGVQCCEVVVAEATTASREVVRVGRSYELCEVHWHGTGVVEVRWIRHGSLSCDFNSNFDNAQAEADREFIEKEYAKMLAEEMLG